MSDTFEGETEATNLEEHLLIWIKIRPRDWFEYNAYKDKQGNYWETPELVSIMNVIDPDIVSPNDGDNSKLPNGLPKNTFNADVNKISSYSIVAEDLKIPEQVIQIRKKFVGIIEWATDVVDIKDYPEYQI